MHYQKFDYNALTKGKFLKGDVTLDRYIFDEEISKGKSGVFDCVSRRYNI